MNDPRLQTLRHWCNTCQQQKPWDEFWAAAKWSDGTMQRPQARCKECTKAARRQRRRQDPQWARELDQRDWQRIKANPDQLERRRELTRENGRVYRLRHGVVADPPANIGAD